MKGDMKRVTGKDGDFQDFSSLLTGEKLRQLQRDAETCVRKHVTDEESVREILEALGIRERRERP